MSTRDAQVLDHAGQRYTSPKDTSAGDRHGHSQDSEEEVQEQHYTSPKDTSAGDRHGHSQVSEEEVQEEVEEVQEEAEEVQEEVEDRDSEADGASSPSPPLAATLHTARTDTSINTSFRQLAQLPTVFKPLPTLSLIHI